MYVQNAIHIHTYKNGNIYDFNEWTPIGYWFDYVCIQAWTSAYGKYSTVGSARVVTSPIDPSSPEEIFRRMRRIILPDRV